MIQRCSCGNEKVETFQHSCWDVSPAGETRKTDAQFLLGRCTKCGVVRQMEPPFREEQEFEEFYREQYPPTGNTYVAKTPEHDRQVAAHRRDACGIIKGSAERLLDVGSGSGAFVSVCRETGLDAYGCEIATYAYGKPDGLVYRRRLEDVNFPADYFDKVTCFDMLEHVMNPVRVLSELFRITKQGGCCFVEIPRFFHPSGEHHWKREHLWFFTEEQLKSLLEQTGFASVEINHPIESKVLCSAVKPPQERPSVLVPPGIGDSYWSVVKLQSFLEREGLGLPDIYVAAPREKKFQGHKRSFPFLEMFPFLHSTGEALSAEGPDDKKLWREAYSRPGRTIFKNVLGCDYFMSYNGHLRVGKPLEAVDPDLKCNWTPPMFVSLEQDYFRQGCIERYGSYAVFYFIFQGTYSYWTRQFPVESVVQLVRSITVQTKCVPVFVGALWDAESPLLNRVKAAVPGCVDLVGKTSVAQLFGVLRGAKVTVGYPSGLTIASAALGVKTLIIWNDFYDGNFAWYAVPPAVRGTTYFAENTKSASAEYLAARATELVEGMSYGRKVVLPRWTESYHSKVDEFSEAGLSTPEVRKSAGKTAAQTSALRRSPQMDASLVVACVLKSGGDFAPEHVVRLRSMVERNTSVEHQFVCLSDVDISNVATVKLLNGHDRYWSKVELFRPGLLPSVKRIVYFDLDTVIVGGVDDVLMVVGDFVALRPWNPSNRVNGMFASGMMAWNNDGTYSFIQGQFNASVMRNYPAGDQEYMSKMLRNANKRFVFFQDAVPGIYSYKRNCRNGLPSDARVVCFHGRPRPNELAESVPWVRDNWR